MLSACSLQQLIRSLYQKRQIAFKTDVCPLDSHFDDIKINFRRPIPGLSIQEHARLHEYVYLLFYSNHHYIF